MASYFELFCLLKHLYYMHLVYAFKKIINAFSLVFMCVVQIGDSMGWPEEGECVILVLGGYVPIH